MVTGATNGIGEATARRLAGAGMSVTLVGRSASRLAAARERIAAAVPRAELRLERADLAELDEVRDLVGRLRAGPPPDVVVSNAAVVAPLDRRTSDGLPRMLTTNYLAPYLLLRELAAVADRSRLVLVASDPALLAPEPVDLDDLTFARPERLGEPAELRPYHAYLRIKNMNLMFAHEFARRLASSATTVNACHPGMIAGTGLGGEAPGIGPFIMQAYQDGTLPPPSPQPSAGQDEELPGPDVGADMPVWLATSPAVDGATGGFYADRSRVELEPHTTDPQRCQQLWERSADLVGLPA
ncbi:SDR family NAD(P)-dependent oxidoreductase [Saccharopolyspora sp. NPDC000359]|uniref:SDR family NAD(P)-dependent oxidoreductase n=1 Tax=Saccharopolyspora sp. NPDC000359 TaxID=3154251 RepID=UPI00331878DD